MNWNQIRRDKNIVLVWVPVSIWGSSGKKQSELKIEYWIITKLCGPILPLPENDMERRIERVGNLISQVFIKKQPYVHQLIQSPGSFWEPWIKQKCWFLWSLDLNPKEDPWNNWDLVMIHRGLWGTWSHNWPLNLNWTSHRCFTSRRALHYSFPANLTPLKTHTQSSPHFSPLGTPLVPFSAFKIFMFL